MTFGNLTKLYVGQCVGASEPSVLWVSQQDFEDSVDAMVTFSKSPEQDRQRILAQGYFQFRNAMVMPTQNSGLLAHAL